ncbi:hypothetical protein SELMODRAFT_417968 [Selaginella moellendorffii]|uniref:Uncharacterized protein n=1 Tax=Selaginella moellendorffii TaxID=88036 RepID=D8S486_SELML|nr:hypothetical protein SELMODRAFT_417968 [Selaginella moellendorffii]
MAHKISTPPPPPPHREHVRIMELDIHRRALSTTELSAHQGTQQQSQRGTMDIDELPNKADTVTWRPRRAGPSSPPPSSITPPPSSITWNPRPPSPPPSTITWKPRPTVPSAPSSAAAAAAFVASPGVLAAGIVMLLLALVAIVTGVWIHLKRRRNKVHGDIILVEYGHQPSGGNSGSSRNQREHLITKVEPRPSSRRENGCKRAPNAPIISTYNYNIR